MRNRKPGSLVGRLFRGIVVLVGAALASFIVFMGLPLLQHISGPPEKQVDVRPIAQFEEQHPPPPKPVEAPKPAEEKPPEEPPPPIQDQPRANLDDLSSMLDPLPEGDGTGGGVLPGFQLDPGHIAIQDPGKDNDGPFEGQLDQKPRPVYQPAPVITSAMRGKAGTVFVIFVVDPSGRVETPIVQKSCGTALDGAALAAVRQWKFDPGMRNGKAVRFRMRVPIKFE